VLSTLASDVVKKEFFVFGTDVLIHQGVHYSVAIMKSALSTVISFVRAFDATAMSPGGASVSSSQRQL